MKSLIKNYIDLLSMGKLNEFGNKNDIKLNNNELEFILKLIKENWEDILKNEDKYFKQLDKNINSIDAEKIKKLFIYYKNKYKGYLF